MSSSTKGICAISRSDTDFCATSGWSNEVHRRRSDLSRFSRRMSGARERFDTRTTARSNSPLRRPFSISTRLRSTGSNSTSGSCLRIAPMILGSMYSDTVSVMAICTRPSTEDTELRVSSTAASSVCSMCSACRRKPSPCTVSLRPSECRVKSCTFSVDSRFLSEVVSDGWLT
ncbi:hypothetical protein D3C87_1100250 [compost metagenome]